MTRRLKLSLPGRWVEQALCRAMGDESFFPPDDKPVARDFYRRAQLVCCNCPVQLNCLEYGIDENYGVWGGLSPQERRAIRLTPSRTKLKQVVERWSAARKQSVDWNKQCDSQGPHGAVCMVRRGHIGRHGGMDSHGEWRSW